MNLRRWLSLTIVALVLIGVTATAVASTLWLRNYLYARVDAQLETQGRSLEAGLSDWWTHASQGIAGTVPFPMGAIVELHHDGRTVRLAPALATQRPSGPLYQEVGSSAPVGEPVSVATSVGQYRILVVEEEDVRALIGLPLSAANQAIADIVRLQIIVASVVLAAMAVIAWLIVRQGLRPLDAMVCTATVIATSPLGGLDLSRRVPNTALRSEAQRLAAALNGMLDHLQSAFAERERSEERVRRFVADASHELRTPLTAVRGYSEMLRAGMLDRSSGEDALRRIHEEAERMAILVEDMLVLASLDAQRPLSFANIDVEQVARDVIADFSITAPQQVILTSQGTVMVWADRDALQQMLGNVLGNVRVHTPPKTKVTVDLAYTEDNERAGHAVLTVVDDGPGFPPGTVDQAFDRFFRADSDRSRAGGGSGLGLAIVAGLAAAHFGTAALTSEPGKGTTVTITLPCGPIISQPPQFCGISG